MQRKGQDFFPCYTVASVYTNFQIVMVNAKGNVFTRERNKYRRIAKFSIKLSVRIPSAVASKARAQAIVRKRKNNKDAVL